MDYRLKELLSNLNEILRHAPGEDECTPDENELYADAQNLKESIERYLDSQNVPVPNNHKGSKDDTDIFVSFRVIKNACKKFRVNHQTYRTIVNDMDLPFWDEMHEETVKNGSEECDFSVYDGNGNTLVPWDNGSDES